MAAANVVPAPKEASFSGEIVLLDGSWGLVDESTVEGLRSRFAETLGLKRVGGERNVALLRDQSLGEEEYLLEVSPRGITVTAGSRSGFLHASSTLAQVRDGPILPVGKVRDYPRLATRGIHLTFETIRQMQAGDMMALITSAAKLKLNTILIEFGDRFPFEKHAVVRSPSALTREEVQRIVSHARSLGVQAIPLLQSLGHLDYVLKHDEYADIREEDEVRHQMCPTNEKSFQTFTELAEEILSLFPDTCFMHIGADETRQLGVCPRCSEEAKAGGKGALYLRHTNKVCSWLSDRGITPILWDDILCAHPQVLEALHESAWITYWDYWTTSSPSPLLVARYNPERSRGVVVYDERWQKEWKQELSDVTAKAVAEFAQPVSMEKDLGEQFLQVFGGYLGDQLPKYVRAFPYLEYYQAHGRHVICSPTCSGNTSDWLSLPDFPRYGANIRSFADRCIEAGAEGGRSDSCAMNLTPGSNPFARPR